MNLSIEAINALAPDDASAKAARGLTALKTWPRLGGNGQALWGECQGSGSKPYQTQADLSGAVPAFRCSCPSRKFPCKHGLALLLLRQGQPQAFAEDQPPPWVSEWLASRLEKAEKKEVQQREKADAPVDPDAARKREQQRWGRIDKALLELRRWLVDQMERGLATLDPQARGQWATMAARLVDAQAPGLGNRVRLAAETLQSVPDWPQRVLRQLGQLQLLCDALQRREQLPAVLQADLRMLVGWPLDKAEVLESGERVTDRWTVLGQVVEEREGNLQERRVWLGGAATGLDALLLDHAFGTRAFPSLWVTGHSVQAELVFYPSAAPQRALVAELTGAAQPPQWPARNLEQNWQRLAERVAAMPWPVSQPMVLTGAVLQWVDEALQLQVDGQVLPCVLGETAGIELLAFGGGHPLTLFGEFDGSALAPLSAWSDEGLWQVQA